MKRADTWISRGVYRKPLELTTDRVRKLDWYVAVPAAAVAVEFVLLSRKPVVLAELTFS